MPICWCQDGNAKMLMFTDADKKKEGCKDQWYNQPAAQSLPFRRSTFSEYAESSGVRRHWYRDSFARRSVLHLTKFHNTSGTRHTLRPNPCCVAEGICAGAKAAVLPAAACCAGEGGSVPMNSRERPLQHVVNEGTLPPCY